MANAFKQKLPKWPRIQNDDYAGLRKFSDYLRQVETAKIRLSSLAVLDDEHENRVLLYKIPDFCHKEWAKQVTRATMEHRSYCCGWQLGSLTFTLQNKIISCK